MNQLDPIRVQQPLESRVAEERVESAPGAEPKAAPRAVIRLLRGGLLSDERARLVLALHGEAVEGYFSAAPAVTPGS